MNQLSKDLLDQTAEIFARARMSMEMANDYLYKKIPKDDWKGPQIPRRSYDGVLRYAWHGMKARVGHHTYKDTQLLMTREEFLDFCCKNELSLREMYRDWAVSGFKKELAISVDRIDPDDHYRIGNIQFLTVRDNRKKEWEDYYNRIPEGMKWCADCRQFLPISSFHKNKRLKRGRAVYCANCTNRKSVAYYKTRK